MKQDRSAFLKTFPIIIDTLYGRKKKLESIQQVVAGLLRTVKMLLSLEISIEEFSLAGMIACRIPKLFDYTPFFG